MKTKTVGEQGDAGIAVKAAGGDVAAKRCAIYLRVSTDEQTCENQLPECEGMARAKGLEVVRIFQETGSAAKHRPVFEQMMAGARAKEFDAVIVWKVDRFGRSMAKNLRDIEELDRLGVVVASVCEDWLDTRGPCRKLMIAIFSWVAEQERETLIERTKAGLRRARAQGKVLGNAALVRTAAQEATLEVWAEGGGGGYRALAKALGVSLALAWEWGKVELEKK